MPVKITLKRNTAQLDALIKNAPARAAMAINRTLEEAQTAQRQLIARSFVDRRGGFLNRMVKIGRGDRATATRLVGSVRVIGPEGREGAAWYLSRHDHPSGPQRRAGVGYSDDVATRIGSLWAIPTNVIRPNFSATVPRSLLPSSLRLTARKDVVGTLAAKIHTTGRGIQQLKGNKRTFVLFGAHGGAPIGVFQRFGTSKLGGRGKSAGRVMKWHNGVRASRDDITLLWRLRSTIQLKPRLRFYETVGDTFNNRMTTNLAGFLTSSTGARSAKR
jgi:hypothetical protein